MNIKFKNINFKRNERARLTAIPCHFFLLTVTTVSTLIVKKTPGFLNCDLPLHYDEPRRGEITGNDSHPDYVITSPGANAVLPGPHYNTQAARQKSEEKRLHLTRYMYTSMYMFLI